MDIINFFFKEKIVIYKFYVVVWWILLVFYEVDLVICLLNFGYMYNVVDGEFLYMMFEI